MTKVVEIFKIHLTNDEFSFAHEVDVNTYTSMWIDFVSGTTAMEELPSVCKMTGYKINFELHNRKWTRVRNVVLGMDAVLSICGD